MYMNGIRSEKNKIETKEKELGIPDNPPFPAAVPSESSSFHLLIRRVFPSSADRPREGRAPLRLLSNMMRP